MRKIFHYQQLCFSRIRQEKFKGNHGNLLAFFTVYLLIVCQLLFDSALKVISDPWQQICQRSIMFRMQSCTNFTNLPSASHFLQEICIKSIVEFCRKVNGYPANHCACGIGAFNFQNLMGLKFRLIDICKKIFFFQHMSENVPYFEHLHSKYLKSASMTRHLIS